MYFGYLASLLFVSCRILAFDLSSVAHLHYLKEPLLICDMWLNKVTTATTITTPLKKEIGAVEHLFPMCVLMQFFDLCPYFTVLD